MPQAAVPHDALNPKVLIEYVYRDGPGVAFWLDVYIDRTLYAQIGPFDTITERQRAHDDLLNMMRSYGATDIPGLMQ